MCVCYKPLDLRTSEWMARGYGVTLMSRDWRIRRLTPLFSRWGNCRTFSSKNLTVPSFGAVYEKGKYSFERGIIALHFDEKYTSLLYPFWRKRGGLAVQVSFKSVARFTIVRQMAPLPSGLSAAMENDVIAAVQFVFESCTYCICVCSCV